MQYFWIDSCSIIVFLHHSFYDSSLYININLKSFRLMTKFCTSRVLFQVKFWIKLATQRHNSTETWLGQGWRLDVLVGHDSAARPADMAGAGIISGMSQLIALAVYLRMITYLRATYRGYQWCSRATEHVIRSQLNWTRSLAHTDIHRAIKK